MTAIDRVGDAEAGTNLLVAVDALHLRHDDLLDPMFAGQRRQLFHLRRDHVLIGLEVIVLASVPVRAEAVEFVGALGLGEEFGHPGGALVDARLRLQGDGAQAAGAVVGAVAGAWGADFGFLGGLQVVDGALDGDMSVSGLVRERHGGCTQFATAV